MVSVLILTHGGLGPELLESARVIAGRLQDFEALPLEWTDGFDQAQAKLSTTLGELDHGDGVLILTDILGGTPYNVAMALRDPGHIEIVSGVNLPMVVRLGCLLNQNLSLTQLTTWIRDKGRSSICCSNDLPAAAKRAAGTEDPHG